MLKEAEAAGAHGRVLARNCPGVGRTRACPPPGGRRGPVPKENFFDRNLVSGGDGGQGLPLGQAWQQDPAWPKEVIIFF
jgi:hypothetical protein